MDKETQAEVVRLLSLIAARLFDQDPLPAVGRLVALAAKYQLAPSQLGMTVDGIGQVEALQRERDEAIMASWRDVAVFMAAAKAKGYDGATQIAAVLNVSVSMVIEWKELGKVPAVFFALLRDAPTRRDREKEIRGVMQEAKRRVREERRKRELAARKRRAVKAAAPAAPLADQEARV